MNIAEIKEAIAKLPPREYRELLTELFPNADDDWERRMKADAESGRLDFIDRNVQESVAKGTALSLETGFDKGS